MNIIVKLKRAFRRHSDSIEVWDTSAISTWLDEFQVTMCTQRIKIVIPEGVVHELSAGRHTYEKCREAYNYINDTKGTKLIIYITKDNMRSWPIDEQVVAIAHEYYKKGYNVTLVTCDRDQANKAGYRDIAVRLLKGNRYNHSQVTKNSNSDIEITKREYHRPRRIEKVKSEFSIPCITKNKETYISIKQGI